MTSAIVVGGGISGIACAAALGASGIDTAVHERSQRLGGRLASRTLRGTGTAFDGRVVDIGASYFTATVPEFIEVIDRLTDRGVVRPWTTAFHVAGPDGLEGVSTGPMRFAAPGGLRSVVEDLARDCRRTEVRLASAVGRVVHQDGTWLVDGVAADAVALCMPEPQAIRIVDCLPVSPIPWEPVIAVTCVFDRRYWRDLDGVFVNDDPVLTWIADDGSRRGDAAPVLVAHVNPVLAARHLDDPAAVIPASIAAIQRVLGITAYPDWVDAHRWTFSKPLVGHEDPCWLSEDGGLGLAGDIWAGGPRVEAAWLSGTALGKALAARL